MGPDSSQVTFKRERGRQDRVRVGNVMTEAEVKEM